MVKLPWTWNDICIVCIYIIYYIYYIIYYIYYIILYIYIYILYIYIAEANRNSNQHFSWFLRSPGKSPTEIHGTRIQNISPFVLSKHLTICPFETICSRWPPNLWWIIENCNRNWDCPNLLWNYRMLPLALDFPNGGFTIWKKQEMIAFNKSRSLCEYIPMVMFVA